MKKNYTYNTLNATSCNNQRVLLRADLNVPLTGGTIENDFRLQEIRPTLDILLKQHATVILVTHLGRPEKDRSALSTTIITTWLQEHGYPAIFAPTITAAHEHSTQNPNTIIVLENIRTFPGETTYDHAFAKELAALGDCYVNDAFGTLHRNDASISLVPLFFAPEKRFIGLLIARELQLLKPLIAAAQNHNIALSTRENTDLHPFVVVLGGGKVADKLPLIEGLLDKADTILLCPAIVSTFMKAKGLSTGKSLVDESLVHHCKKLIVRAEQTKTELIFPTDLQVAAGSWNGPLSDKKSDQLLPDDVSIALGPLSTLFYAEKITVARTVFFNAAMGFTQRPETLFAAKTLIETLGASAAYAVIGGGDSVALANAYSFEKLVHRPSIHGLKTKHLSTGGGATLTYLSGAPLPGLEALCKKQEKLY